MSVFLKFAAAAWLALGLFTGCKSSDTGGSGSYGPGSYDPWYYGDYAYHGDIIAAPPPARPDGQPHPEQPIYRPSPPMPSIPSVPRPAPRR